MPQPLRKRTRVRRRSPSIATPEYLARAAARYLARYAAPAAHVRRLLMLKVIRSARAHGTDPAEGAAVVDSLVSRFSNSGLIDDAAYARNRVAWLRKRGASRDRILRLLATKGVKRDQIAEILVKQDSESKNPELTAALIYARRRRIGPYRPPRDRAENRERDLALLGRRGFDYDLSRRIINTRELADLEAEAGLL